MDTSRLSEKLQRFFLREAEITGEVTFFVRRTSKLSASLMLRKAVPEALPKVDSFYFEQHL